MIEDETEPSSLWAKLGTGSLSPTSPERPCAPVTASSIQIEVDHYGPLRRYSQFPLQTIRERKWIYTNIILGNNFSDILQRNMDRRPLVGQSLESLVIAWYSWRGCYQSTRHAYHNAVPALSAIPVHPDHLHHVIYNFQVGTSALESFRRIRSDSFTYRHLSAPLRTHLISTRQCLLFILDNPRCNTRTDLTGIEIHKERSLLET